MQPLYLTSNSRLSWTHQTSWCENHFLRNYNTNAVVSSPVWTGSSGQGFDETQFTYENSGNIAGITLILVYHLALMAYKLST